MYYLKQTTYDQLPDELQEKVLSDTRKYYKEHGKPLPMSMITGTSDDERQNSTEADGEDLVENKKKVAADFEESKQPEKVSGKHCSECGAKHSDSEHDDDDPWDKAYKNGQKKLKDTDA